MSDQSQHSASCVKREKDWADHKSYGADKNVHLTNGGLR